LNTVAATSIWDGPTPSTGITPATVVWLLTTSRRPSGLNARAVTGMGCA
jgi:hypothetical protein